MLSLNIECIIGVWLPLLLMVLLVTVIDDGMVYIVVCMSVLQMCVYDDVGGCVVIFDIGVVSVAVLGCYC